VTFILSYLLRETSLRQSHDLKSDMPLVGMIGPSACRTAMRPVVTVLDLS
jgi:hypothetical protein